MHRLTAKAAFPFANRALVPGDQFDAEDREAETLLAIGYAMRAEDGTEGQAPIDEPPIEHEAGDVEVADEPFKRKRGRPRKDEYARRDLRAEGSE